MFVVSLPAVGSVTPKACRRSCPLAICGQICSLLGVVAVAQQRAHDVHLRVAGRGVAAGAIDLLEDQRCLGEAETGSAILARDQRREIARLGQRRHERVGIGSLRIELAPVRMWK